MHLQHRQILKLHMYSLKIERKLNKVSDIVRFLNFLVKNLTLIQNFV